jgi:hypothetical protein
VYVFAAELLHIPPGSKDAAVFSPGGDKGSTAAPGQLVPILSISTIYAFMFIHLTFSFRQSKKKQIILSMFIFIKHFGK